MPYLLAIIARLQGTGSAGATGMPVAGTEEQLEGVLHFWGGELG